MKLIARRTAFGNRGSILMESIVGISLVTVGILGIIALLIRSSSLYNLAVDNLKATYLAAEGVEVLKNIIDANYVARNNSWNPPPAGWGYVDYAGGAFSPLSVPPAPETADFLKINGGVYNNETGANSIFRRIVRVESAAGGYLAVKSYVTWNEGGSERQVLLEDHFYPWRPNF